MHFSTIIVTALFGASTLAVPAFKRALLCPGIDSTPQCCAVNALNLADLNCAPRTSWPNLFSIHPKFYPFLFCPMKTVAYQHSDPQLRLSPRTSRPSRLSARLLDSRLSAVLFLL